jgi:hypothetical protein
MTVFRAPARLERMMDDVRAAASTSDLDWLESEARAGFSYPHLAHLEEMIAAKRRVLARDQAHADEPSMPQHDVDRLIDAG